MRETIVVVGELLANTIFILGVIDPDTWSQAEFARVFQHFDEAFSSYFTYCHSEGPKCAFYGATPLAIKARLLSIMEQLQVQPNHATAKQSQLFLQVLIALKALIVETTSFTMARFTALGNILVSLESSIKHKNTTALVAFIQEKAQTDPTELPTVYCIDAPSTLNSKLSRSYIDEVKGQSAYAWEHFILESSYCEQWPIVAAYRYPGELTSSKTKLIL